VSDLRYMSAETFANFPLIVKGAYTGMGMPDFSSKLSDVQIEELRQYIAKRNADLRGDLAAGHGR